MRAKGNSGKHLGSPPYGYRSDPEDKHHWIIDEEAAPVIRRIFDLTIDGKGPTKIARILEQDQVLTTKALYAKQKGKPLPDKPYRWVTIQHPVRMQCFLVKTEKNKISVLKSFYYKSG